MKKRLISGLSGARFAKPLFNGSSPLSKALFGAMVLLGSSPVISVEVTESEPVYVAPGASSGHQRPVTPAQSIPAAPEVSQQIETQPQAASYTSSTGVTGGSIAADSSSDDVEDFGIITDSVEPANPLADDRSLLIEELQSLRSKVEEQDRQIKVMQQKSKALYEDLDRRLQKMAEKLVKLEQGGVQSNTDANPQVTLSAQDAPKVAEGDEAQSKQGDSDQARYLMAKGIMDEGGRDTKAALEFVKLLRDYPDTPLKPNVYYWLAQIYKRGGENTKAESFYNKVLDEYPKSLKAASSLYSLADMKVAQGNPEEAKKLLTRLVSDYPNSAEAVKAKKKLASQ